MTTTISRNEAVKQLAELKKQHRRLREESATVCAKSQRAKFIELKEKMDELRRQEGELLAHFPNEHGPGVNDKTVHQKLHEDAETYLDLSSAGD